MSIKASEQSLGMTGFDANYDYQNLCEGATVYFPMENH